MLALKILYKLALGFVSFYALMWLIEILVRWRLREQTLIVMLVIWLIPLVSLEIVWLWRKRKPLPRFLTHLRYAPIAILFSFIVITLSFDAAMVQYSKYQIHSYVYGSMTPEQEFRLDLHNTNRGWCGNGQSATEYWLYADTAAEGFSSSDPKVRARSLRMSLQTYDWLNGVEKDSPFPKLIRQAAQDEDPLVRQMAMEFLKDRKGF
jgi:hypothetical protein